MRKVEKERLKDSWIASENENEEKERGSNNCNPNLNLPGTFK